MEKELDMIVENKKDIDKLNWDDMYEITKSYYEHYGDLAVAPEFKTINGVEEDENGIKLLDWIDSQRQKIRSKSLIGFLMGSTNLSNQENERLDKMKQLTDEQVLSLACIGFRTDTFQSNYKSVKEFLSKHGVTNTEIIFQMRLKSYIELCAIEDYLNSKNIPVYEDGILHPIFYMTGIMMKELYGFYKHELVTSYISKLTKDDQKKLIL